MKKSCFLFFILLFPLLLISQNLVPNPSFEEYNHLPSIWIHYSDDFNTATKQWTAATGSGPDLVSPKSPNSVYKNGTFGIQTPRTGDVAVGLTIWEKGNNSNHYFNDVIQIKLTEKILENNCYKIKFWICKRLDALYTSNNLGVAISDTLIQQKSYKHLILPTVFNVKEIIDVSPKEWLEIEGTFTATQDAEYLLIGNFFKQEETIFKKTSFPLNISKFKPIAYYYIDDVELTLNKETSICNEQQMISVDTIVEDKKFSLPNIGFILNSDNLSAQATQYLDTIIEDINLSYSDTIKIIGYTDITGIESYNQNLSFDRAKNVKLYLQSKGINQPIIVEGLGASNPVGDNNTEEGRAKNRRVEIYFISKKK